MQELCSAKKTKKFKLHYYITKDGNGVARKRINVAISAEASNEEDTPYNQLRSGALTERGG